MKHHPIADDTLRVDPLSVLLPECRDPEERELRHVLMKARDVASAAFARRTIAGHAKQLALILVETAGAWIFAPATADDLRAVIDHCRALMRCIVKAEQLRSGE